MNTEPDWLPVSSLPFSPKAGIGERDYIVRGPNVSGRVGGKFSCWMFDGCRWWCEDGTEMADEQQMRNAYYCSIPRFDQ